MGDEQRYRVVSKIAAGGMAEVYQGETAGIEGFRKKVAIKRVLPKLSQNKQFIDMFLDEARLGAYLSHSRCVQVFDIGQGAGSHFIVMEYVEGADLKGVLDYLQAKRLHMSVETACFIALQVCEGLEYAHGASDHTGKDLNIVHRDISPHNVLMTRFGEVKLVDFGLAKASSHLTDDEEDIVKGKFGYLAPEVTMGKKIDKRVDVFAAGILLWEMLAGRRLFLGATDLETFKLVQAAQIPDPRQFRKDDAASIDTNLVRVLVKALARDPDERYQTAGSFAKDLSRVLFFRRNSVTYHDVAKLVQATAADAKARKKAEQKDDSSGADEMLGDLLIEALHDFTGILDGDDGVDDGIYSKLGTRGVEAGGGDFVDVGNWGLDDDDVDGAVGGLGPASAKPATPEPAAVADPSVPPPPAAEDDDSALAGFPLEEPAPATPEPAPAAAPTPTPPPAAQPAQASGGSSALPWMVAIIAIAAAVAGWIM